MKRCYPYLLLMLFCSAPRAAVSAQELTPQDYLLEASRSYAAGDSCRAGILFTKAAEADSCMDAAWFYLGRINRMKGSYGEAEQCLRKAVALDSLNFWYLDALAGLYIDSDSITKAVPLLLKMSDRFPDRINPRSHLVLGDHYRTSGQDSLAMRHYQETLRMSPEYSPAHFSLAEIYRMQGNFYHYFKHLDIFLEDPYINPSFKSHYLEQAVFSPQFVNAFKPQVDTMVLCILKAHPADSAILRTAATYYMRSDERDKGIALYRKNLELYPDDHAINIEYVSLLYYLEKWEELKDNVRNMMQTFPDDETLYEVLAIALWKTDDLKGAAGTYRKQLKKTRNQSIRTSCCTALGDLYQQAGEMKKAGTYYRKGLAIDPEYIPLLNNYAYYLCSIGKDYGTGLKMSKKTILSEPDNPTYLDTYGWLLYLTGDYQDAKAQFKRAMLFGGKENGVIMDHYADVLWALKDYEMAFIYYEQADKLDPTLNISEKVKARRAEIGR